MKSNLMRYEVDTLINFGQMSYELCNMLIINAETNGSSEAMQHTLQ